MKVRSQLEIFATGLDHPECVITTADGELYAGGEAGQIYRVTGTGSVTVVAQLTGCCLGMALAPNESLVVCTVDPPAVYCVDPRNGRSVTSLSSDSLITPNFPVLTPDGSLIVSDSGTWGQANGRLLLREPDGRWTVVADGLAFPNGLALSSDQRTLYVVESSRDRIVHCDVQGFRNVGVASVFVSGIDHVPDGLALHPDGTLYVGCYARDAVYAVDGDGRLTLLVEDPDAGILNRPTNLAVSPDGLSLFAANFGGRHITRISLSAAGLRTLI